MTDFGHLQSDLVWIWFDLSPKWPENGAKGSNLFVLPSYPSWSTLLFPSFPLSLFPSFPFFGGFWGACGLKWHWWCKRCQTQKSPSNPMPLEQCVGVQQAMCYNILVRDVIFACCQHSDATLANVPFWGCFFSNARRKWPSTLTYMVSMAMFHVSTLVLGIHEVHGG